MKSLCYFLACSFLLLIAFDMRAQKVEINGFISDSSTGERLIGANVYLSETEIGVISNSFGYYHLDIPRDKSIELKFSYVGYKDAICHLRVSSDTTLNISLSPDAIIEEVVIHSTNPGKNIHRTEISSINIPMNRINLLPNIGGEKDILKTLQLLPGVQSGNEGTSELYIRGGSPDQNLMILDDVPLYYVNHLGGFVSVFNEDIISTVKLYKGGFPARYGSRLSSVIDIRMKDGNSNKFHGSYTISPLTFKTHIEGPFRNHKFTYIVSARRFMYDLISRPVSKMLLDGPSLGYTFYDINSKLCYTPRFSDRLYLSFYMGDDNYQVNIKNDNQKAINQQRWGNLLGAFRWNHIFSSKLFSNVTLTYTKYRYKTHGSVDYTTNGKDVFYEADFLSGIHDLTFKTDFEYHISNYYKIRAGTNSTFHTFSPGITRYASSFADTANLIDNKLHAWENAVYLENDLYLFGSLGINAGLRASDYYINGKIYTAMEPRILMSFKLRENISLKAAFSLMEQYVHLASYSGTGMPANFWLPSTERIPPSRSVQYVVGISHTLKKNISLSIEGFYKNLTNLTDFSEGSTFFGSGSDWQDKFETGGIGKVYGIELMAQKEYGKLQGWVSYTLSKNMRQFQNINNGEWYPFKFDRRNSFSIALTYKISDTKNAGITWSYGTGNPITLSVANHYAINDPDQWGQEIAEGFIYPERIDIYDGMNSYRMRDYHRLDIGINFIRKKERGSRTWNFSIYNVYNRQNPFYYYWQYDFNEEDPYDNPPKLFQMSLFPMIPTVSYNRTF